MLRLPATCSAIQSALDAHLPPGTVACVGSDGGDPGSLPANEARCVAQAVPRRQRQFAAGRQLARAALEQLGHPVAALPATPDRGPAWPRGVVGSITHTTGLAIAAVSTALDGLGVDAEACGLLPDASAARVLLREELNRWPAGDEQRIAVFAAKEAIYKAFGACAQADAQALDFLDVEVVAADDGFGARPRSARAQGLPGWQALRGRWWTTGAHVVAAAWRASA